MEVWKWKKESHLLVFSVLLTHNCALRSCSKRVTVSQQCESQILGSNAMVRYVAKHNTRLAFIVTFRMRALCRWCWYRWKCCHSYLLGIFPSGLTRHRTTPTIPANIHYSLRMRPWQDYTQCVVLNNCYCSLASEVQVFATLTLLGDSLPFVYKAQLWVSKALDTGRWPFSLIHILFSYFSFCTFHLSLITNCHRVSLGQNTVL